MTTDGKIGALLVLGGATVAVRVLVTLWAHDLILQDAALPSRAAGPIGLLAIAASTVLAIYIVRPAGVGRMLLLGTLYAAATFIGGYAASLFVLSSWGIGL